MRRCRQSKGRGATAPGCSPPARWSASAKAVLVAKVGRCPQGQLAAAGIEPVSAFAHQPIEAAVLGWFAGFAARVSRGEVARPGPAAAPEEPPLAAAG